MSKLSSYGELSEATGEHGSKQHAAPPKWRACSQAIIMFSKQYLTTENNKPLLITSQR